MNKNKILSGGGKNLIGGGKWGRRGREVGEKGEGTGGKGGGNWEWGTPPVHPLHYGRTNDNHSYKMNSKTLKVVNEEQDLRIIFQDDLKFNKRISTKVQKRTVC